MQLVSGGTIFYVLTIKYKYINRNPIIIFQLLQAYPSDSVHQKFIQNIFYFSYLFFKEKILFFSMKNKKHHFLICSEYLWDDIMNIENIEIGRIFLDIKNPRFPEGTCESESDAIRLLCRDEYVPALARDIAENGMNPLEIAGVIQDQKPTLSLNDRTFIVIEGNRRLCALKLLHDPELAPGEHKKLFQQLSEKCKLIGNVPCIVFENHNDTRIWLERLHGDLNGGIGRKKWTADEKQRFSGNTRNKRAQAILDYAQKKAMLTDAQRKDKLTTAQRFLGNPLMREVLGIDDSKSDEVFINRPEVDFEARLKRFIDDLVTGQKVNSRSNKADIVDYARELSRDVKTSGEHVGPVPIAEQETEKKPETSEKSGRKPQNPPRLHTIRYNREIKDLLKKSGNNKLESLYFALCRIELEDHFVPLLTIGTWAFMESLSAAAGRSAGTSFNSFYSNNKLVTLGLGGSSKETRPVLDALNRLESTGNTTKHHFVSAHFNGQQLANDMQCLEPLIIATCNMIITSKI